MTDPGTKKKFAWAFLAVGSLILPVCGYTILEYGPRFIGRPYLWMYFSLPLTGVIAMACSLATVAVFLRAKAWRWACLVSVPTLLASGVAAAYGGMVLLFAGLCVGPTYVHPSWIMRESGLASVPISASRVEGLRLGNIDDRQYFAFFETSSPDIAAFLRDSASIKQPPHAVFDANNAFAPRRMSRDEIYDKWYDDARYTPYLYKVEWFNPDITVRGRLFGFASVEKWGTVIVDDDKNKVYVFLSYGRFRPEK